MIFRGRLSFLSNFYPHPMVWNGKVYPSAEHVYQACKCLDSCDAEIIRLASTPVEAKRIGRTVFMRQDWSEVKLLTMRKILVAKFQDKGLRERLLAVEGQIVEENYWHDNYWGACGCPKCYNVPKLNHLGKILMDLRDEFFDSP